MPVFNIYQLNNADQLDLFFSKSDGTLDLKKVSEKMEDFIATSEDGEINGEGFLNINTTIIEDKKIIESIATGQGSLGYYNQAYISNEEVTSNRKQQTFYSKSRVFITEDNFLIILFDDTTEEKIKRNIKNLVESVGFEVTNFRLSDAIMRNIRNDYTWTEVRLERVDNESDSTKKVYYEIDAADNDNDSLIDKIYRDQGKMVQISFEMPYNKIKDGPNFITVKLYKNDHRIVINASEFPKYEDMKTFIIHLTDILIKLQKK
ncbi:hypothetical protein [Oceanobacillus indicireducens]|uniref:Uncharacterized protein n=1 Tax=Oceanobacillus indicireducens TaxID=1004261 RepID=A0A917XWT7_9BACI|nr:hypothetical protein [Oceanobacillus indicireducens]GGN55044.1 hypothetical protein GCM10007971_13440 [Oceanobacillus indicireducens]